MLGNLRGGEILLLLLVIILIFGAKKLPETARGLGRSLRIFKAETKGLRDDDSGADPADSTTVHPDDGAATRPVEPRQIAPAPEVSPTRSAEPVSERDRTER